jgi:hypothetical protein
MRGSKEGAVWLAAVVFAFGCASTDPRHDPASGSSAGAVTSISIAHYSIEIPAGYEVKDVSPPMTDFELYRVTRHGREKLGCGLYFGFAPKFPQLQWSGQPEQTKGDKRSTRAFQRSGAIEGLIEFSGLTYKNSRIGSPFRMIHYACDRLDEGAARDMLKMIASIKVTRAQLD